MTGQSGLPSVASGGSGRGFVLIVDDECILTIELAEMLDEAGIASRCVGSAQEALSLVGGELEIVAIVTDLKMPDMNGLQLLRHLRDEGHRLPVIIMSGHVDLKERDLALELGALCYLAKPCDICAIPQLLRRHVFGEGGYATSGAGPGHELPRSA